MGLRLEFSQILRSFLEEINILTVLSLSTHECGMSLYSLSSSLISFINVLWFLSSDYALFLYFSIIMAPLVARQWWSCSAGGAVDTGSIPGSGRSPRGRNGNPLQYSCLNNPMDRGAWRGTLCGSLRVKHDSACTHAAKIIKRKA